MCETILGLDLKKRSLVSTNNLFRLNKAVPDMVFWVLVLFVTIFLIILSVLRYTSYNVTMFDIGNMSQSLWSVTQGRPLEFTYHDGMLSRLALHVELIYFLFAPFYATFPSPITLLVAQALLFGAGAFPLYTLAKRRVRDPWIAIVIVWIYLFFPLAQTAVLFDFHGDTLALPLLIFLFDALDRENWLMTAIWLILVLSCKFYMAYAIMVVGLWKYLQENRKVGFLILLLGIIWGGIAIGLIRPAFSKSVNSISQITLSGYAEFYYGAFLDSLFPSMISRMLVALLVFLPVLWFIPFAPMTFSVAFLVALPVLFSAGAGNTSFLPQHHHYAYVVPFIILCVLDGISSMQLLTERQRTFTRHQHRLQILPIFLMATCVVIVWSNFQLYDTSLRAVTWNPFPGGNLFPWGYKRTARDVFKDSWLDLNVPEDADILASPFLAPHLVNRRNLFVTKPLDHSMPPDLDNLLERSDYIVLDGLSDYIGPLGPNLFDGEVLSDFEVITEALLAPDFSLVNVQDGLMLFARDEPAHAGESSILKQQVVTRTLEVHDVPIATFNNEIALVDFEIIRLSPLRYRFCLSWTALRSMEGVPNRFAVSRFVDAPTFRNLHLPTIALYPTMKWKIGEVVVEEFDVMISSEVPSGKVLVELGWYDSSHVLASLTDDRGRIGQLVIIEASNLE